MPEGWAAKSISPKSGAPTAEEIFAGAIKKLVMRGGEWAYSDGDGSAAGLANIPPQGG